jgi:uncharacterized protein (TIGR03000 family)
VIHDSAPSIPTQDIEERESAPVAEPALENTPTPTPDEGVLLPRGTATLAVDVPADAKIYVNGSKTTTEGGHRRYVASRLISNQMYRYEVRAIVDRGGRQRVISKFVTLSAGSQAKMSFEFDFNESFVATN